MISISPEHPLPISIEALFRNIDSFAERFELRYFLIGATARDVLMHHVHGLPIRRASLDVDFAVVVDSWRQYRQMTSALLCEEGFSRHPRIPHRFFFRFNESVQGLLSLDLVPFGGIEEANGTIAWPPDMMTIISVAGYEDALSNAIRVQVSETVSIPICSVSGLTVTKLIAWIDRGSRVQRTPPISLIWSSGTRMRATQTAYMAIRCSFLSIATMIGR